MDNNTPVSSGGDAPLQLNLNKILRSRIKGWKSFLIPDFVISILERIIHQDELNHLLRVGFPLKGSAFAAKILSTLGITVSVEGLESIPTSGKYIFASNHPLGGLDGIALVAVLGSYFGDDNLRVQVNDMLMNVEPLAGVFLPINKYGAQGRHAARLINQAFEEGKQMVVFPAGLVSRLGDDGSIADLEWKKAFVTKAATYGRTIVPVRFEALNSMRFYKTARRRKRLGIKVNIEQALLPSEIFRSEGKHFRIVFGTPITPEQLVTLGESPDARAAAIRERVYSQEPGA